MSQAWRVIFGCLTLLLSSATASLPGARAHDTSSSTSLDEVLSIEELTVEPAVVRDDEPFTIRALLVNQGPSGLLGLRWYPSISADPSKPTDNPPIEFLGRSPDHLDLPAGERARASLSFRVTTLGERRYGLVVESDDPGQGIAFGVDPTPRTTAPYSAGFVLARCLAALSAVVLLAGLFRLAYARSAGLRHEVQLHLHPVLAPRDWAGLAAALLALAAGLNLPWLIAGLDATGWVPPNLLGRAILLFIPLRWAVPLLVALWLARGRTPALFAVGLLMVVFVQANARLIGQVSPSDFLEVCSPGLILAGLYLGLRQLPRSRLVAPSLTAGAVVLYALAAYPWFRLYVEQVL